MRLRNALFGSMADVLDQWGIFFRGDPRRLRNEATYTRVIRTSENVTSGVSAASR